MARKSQVAGPADRCAGYMASLEQVALPVNAQFAGLVKRHVTCLVEGQEAWWVKGQVA